MANITNGQRRQVWAPLYDSARYAAGGQTSCTFFQDAYGAGTSAHSGSGGKTLADTNLRGRGGMLPGGEAMKVRGIRVKFKTSNINAANPLWPVDLGKLQYDGTLLLKVGGTTFVEQQLVDFNAGVGRTGYAATTAATTTMGDTTNGVAHVDNFWKFYEDQVITLDDSLSIECSIFWPGATAVSAATVITVQFEGLRSGLLVG